MALVVIGWLILSVGAWLGWSAPASCQLGRGLAGIAGSNLLEGLAIICLVTKMMTLFTWHHALLWALLLVFAGTWIVTEVPQLLSTC